MNDLAVIGRLLPPTAPAALKRILEVESAMRKREEVTGERAQIPMDHLLHGGMYARTAWLGANTVIIGALIKIPTILAIRGSAWVFAGDKWHLVSGYQVIPASAGRKQIFAAVEPTELTMLFPTQARTVEEAEAEFTDEGDKLLSRREPGNDTTVITEAQRCQA